MIVACIVHGLQVVKERLAMTIQPVLADRQVAPGQVWAKLSVEIQIHAIGLLAQFILNVVVSRTGGKESTQEVSDACSSEHAQNPA